MKRKRTQTLPIVEPDEIAFTAKGHMKVYARCPFCQSWHSARSSEDGVIHRRKCMSCGRPFSVNITSPQS